MCEWNLLTLTTHHGTVDGECVVYVSVNNGISHGSIGTFVPIGCVHVDSERIQTRRPFIQGDVVLLLVEHWVVVILIQYVDKYRRCHLQQRDGGSAAETGGPWAHCVYAGSLREIFH